MEGMHLNRKRTKKGFTLVELIIVLAIFSIILSLVMSFIDPVSKLMTKASIKERTAAYVDNIEEYVDNSIHYAKFVRVYEGGYCTASDESVVVSDEQTAVESFVDWFLGGVISPPADDGTVSPAKGKVRVMKLINSGSDAGHIYESVYDFTAAESYEKITYKLDGSIDNRELILRDGGNPSSVTLVSTSDVINPEHFKDYNYYYKLGFYNLDPIPSSSDAYKNAGRNAYYSWLMPLTDNSGNEIEYDSNTGKNFALNVIAYQPGNMEKHTYNDGTNDITVDIFKSPCHMSTASMAFINAIKTNEANSAPFYKLKVKEDDGTLDLKDGKVQFETISSVNMGLAFRIMKPPIDADGDGINDEGGDGNIYIIYILPEEIYDSQIVYK